MKNNVALLLLILLATGGTFWYHLQKSLYGRGFDIIMGHKDIINERLERVKRVCDKHNLTSSVPSQKWLRILCFPTVKLCFCPQAKVATTTWMKIFMSLTNQTIDQRDAHWIRHLHRDLRKVYSIDPRQIGQNGSNGVEEENPLKQYLTFTVIRNPLERIVSTYRDKIVEWENYRNWRQMVHYNPSKPYEAFHRFVALLTDTKLESNLLFAGQRGGGNVHLEYFWRRCDLCHIHFDVVANLETFQLDSQYILDKAKVPKEWRKKLYLNQSYHVSVGESTSSLTRTLLGQLSPPLRQKLFAMYKIDLEMFGYDDEDLSHFLAGQKKQEEDNV